MIELVVRQLRVGQEREGHVLLLQDREGQRVVPVWVSSVAAADHVQALDPDSVADHRHPSRIDFILELVSVLDATVQELRITGESEGVFDCQLVVNDLAVACRLSDGVALSVRMGARIVIDPELFDRVGLVWDHASDNCSLEWNDHHSTLQSFREFLEGVDPGDFQP